MNLPDVNVLIYAYRPDAAFHPLCRPWLEASIQSNAKFALSRLILSAVVRILTNRKVYKPPETLDEVFGYCDHLLSCPNVVQIEPGPGHWQIFEDLCRKHTLTGADVSDAWHAALAIEHGCQWVTLDRGFSRFKGLRWHLLK